MIKLKQLLNESYNKPLYHATYKELLPSIMKHGLGGIKTKANWEDSETGVVYLANDIDEAESYAETSDLVPDEWLDEIVILKINSNKIDLSKLTTDKQNQSGTTLQYHGVIPQQALKIIK